MGLERRGNGLYYYRKERRGGRVVSVYAGRGEIAGLIASLEQGDRREREYKREQQHKARAQVERTDKAVRELNQIAQAVARAMLLVNGCHTHKGQWRKCKNKTKRQ